MPVSKKPVTKVVEDSGATNQVAPESSKEEIKKVEPVQEIKTEQPKSNEAAVQVKELLAAEPKDAHNRLTPELNVKYYFGVDSVTPAMNNVGNGESLYDYVVRIAGKKPDFWGRYLSTYAITKEEVAFLHGKGCAILLIYNWTTASIVGQGYASGVSQAHIAITQAQALGAPQNIIIACDDEAGWPINPAFIGGWSDTMRSSNYYGAGMFYGNPLDGVFSGAYNTAYKTYPSIAEDPFGLVWSCEPENGETFPIPNWNPAYPSSNAIGTTFWQYAINYNNLIDLDLASQEGFDSLWKAIVTVQALHTCALKPDTTHTSKSIHTIFGGDKGVQHYQETVQDKTTNQKEVWLNVTFKDKNGKEITGFVPQKEITVIE